jgi:hypothetical protein
VSDTGDSSNRRGHPDEPFGDGQRRASAFRDARHSSGPPRPWGRAAYDVFAGATRRPLAPIPAAPPSVDPRLDLVELREVPLAFLDV